MSCDLLNKWLATYDPIHRGYTPDGIANGLTATAGWFFPRIRGGYNLRRAVDRKPDMTDPIVGAVGYDAVSITNFAWWGHAASTTYYYRVNAIGPGGVEELGDGNIARVEFDAFGSLVGPRPNRPTNLQLALLAGGAFELRWTYSEAGEETAPNVFRVYNDNGTGTMDYGTIVATVTYRARRFHYAYSSGAFADGVTIRWAVRAVSAAGIDDGNTDFVIGTADADGPPVHPTILADRGTETR
jgi:hypothetical protein